MTKPKAQKTHKKPNTRILYGLLLGAEAITTFLALRALAKLNLLHAWQYFLVV